MLRLPEGTERIDSVSFRFGPSAAAEEVYAVCRRYKLFFYLDGRELFEQHLSQLGFGMQGEAAAVLNIPATPGQVVNVALRDVSNLPPLKTKNGLRLEAGLTFSGTFGQQTDPDFFTVASPQNQQ